MSNISVNKVVTSHLSDRKVVNKSNSGDPLSFESLLNQRVSE
jgi:hypothetical protein